MNIDQLNELVKLASDLGTLGHWLRSRDSKAVLIEWHSMLANVEFEEATKLLRRIVAGEIELDHSSWSSFPRVVLRHANRAAKNEPSHNGPAEFVRCRRCEARFRLSRGSRHCPSCHGDDWGDEYSCLDCLDRGIVVIWSLAAMEEARRRLEEGRSVDLPMSGRWTCAIGCGCGRSPAIRGRFDAACMVPIEVPTPTTALERLVEHVERVVFGQIGRLNEFDAFNAGV